MPTVIGGRYGLSSKEFTPGMVAGVFDELARKRPKRRFTIGINDDVSQTSLTYDPSVDIEPKETVRAVFFGLGSDGTVGANKNTIKILGDAANLHAQGYFVYDSKKSGSQTVSHLRFGPQSIHAPYLVSAASFVGCHQIRLIERSEVLDRAAQARRCCSTVRRTRIRSGTPCRVTCRRRSSTRRSGFTRSTPGRSRGTRDWRGGEHRPADVLLRDLRCDGARAGDRVDQGVDPEDLRQARRGGGQPQHVAVDRSVAALHRFPFPIASSTGRRRRSCPRTHPSSSGR